MSTLFHYDDTPVPAGYPVSLNGSKSSYALALYDGATYDDQYPDEPEHSVGFESADGAKAWLDAVVAVLTPYIASGDRAARIPDPDGWTIWEEPQPASSEREGQR